MVQPFHSSFKNPHFRSLSCQLFVSRLWTDESAACGLRTWGCRCNTAWLFLSFQTSFWEVETDSCAAARCQCGVSEWPRGAGAIYHKGTFWLLYFDITAAETTTWGRRLSVGVSCFWSILMRYNDQSIERKLAVWIMIHRLLFQCHICNSLLPFCDIHHSKCRVLEFGQKKKPDDVTLGSGKLWWAVIFFK